MTIEKRLYALENKVHRNSTKENHGDIGDVLATFMMIHELRGFWPFSSIDENGAARDISGQNRLLTNNGGVGRSQDYASSVPVSIFTGTSNWTRADEAGLDVTTLFTLGGWFKFANFTSDYGVMSKDGASGTRSYLITSIATTGQIAGAIFPAGTSASAQTIFSDPVTANTWYFIVLRFISSSVLDLYINNVRYRNSSVSASTFNSTSPFNIGAVNEGQRLPNNSMAALCFLSAAALTEPYMTRLFNSTRWIFGV